MSDLCQDLLRAEYRQHGRTPTHLDCMGLVLLISERMGRPLPDPRGPRAREFFTGWEPRRGVPEPGDLIFESARDREAIGLGGPDHVGIFLGGSRWIHARDASPSVVVERWRRGRAYRWVGASDGSGSLPLDSGSCAVVILDLAKGRSIHRVDPRSWTPAPGLSLLYGELVAGGAAVYASQPAGVDPLTQIAIGVGLSLLSALVQQIFTPAAPSGQEANEPASPTFDLSGLSNTTGIGNVQPVVYGEHRVGGHIISAFQRPDEAGRSVLYLLLMLSRGPIQSIGGLTTDQDDLTGSAIPSTIEIDGNPASSYQCQISTRLGSQDQEPIPGFRETITNTSYAVTLYPAQPFTHEPTVKIEAYEVVVTFPSGLYDIDAQGGVQGRHVAFTVRHRVFNGPTSGWVNNSWLVFREARSQTSSYFRVSGLTPERYEIQIERIAPPWPESGVNQESQSVLTEIHEITNDALSYPGRTLLALKAVGTDQLNSAIPNITSLVRGRVVWVWNGTTWAEAWSDNPAWIVLDILLHPIYGLGRNPGLTLANIDLPGFLAWADKCDELVDDGRGGTTQRARCDLNVNSAENPWDLANSIAHSAWARLTLSGDKITPIIEEWEAPIYTFAMGNVTDAEITYIGSRQRMTAVEVQYLNEETNYETDLALKLLDESDIRKETLNAAGVTRPSQAYRLAQWRLNFHEESTKRIAFTAGRESLHLLPGDPIGFTHKSLGQGVSGRVTAAASATVTLDMPIDASSGTHKISVVTRSTGADVVQTRTLTAGNYAAGVAITVTSAWNGGDIPVAGDPYAAGLESTYLGTYRITSVETSPDMATRRIAADLITEAIYDDDPGDVEEFTDIMPSPKALPSAVEDLSAREMHTIDADGGMRDAVLVSWQTTERWHGADVWVADRTDSTTPPVWSYVGRSWNGRIQHNAVAGGASYVFSVVPLSPRGTNRGPDYGSQVTIFVRGWRRIPDGPMSATAQIVGGMVTLRMMKPDDPSIAGFEVWWGLVRLAKCAPDVLTFPCPWIGTETLTIRTVSRHGKRSWDKVTIDIEHVVPEAIGTTDVSADEHPGWSGASIIDIDPSGGTLLLDGGALTGEYIGAASTPYLDGFRQTHYLRVRSSLSDVALTWDHCAFRWNDPQADQTWNNGVLTGFEVGEHLTWDDCGFPWDSLPGDCTTWAGPIDILASIEVDIQADLGSGAVDWPGPNAETINEISPIVTLQRPHEDYQPQVEEITTNTVIDGGSEPERVTYQFLLGDATAANARQHGFVANNSSSAALVVPTGKLLTILYAQGTFRSGASAGTYTVDIIIRNDTDSSDVVLATATTSSTSTSFRTQSEGTRAAPLGTLAAGKAYRVGWFNRASSPGALTNVAHQVVITAIMEDA